MNKKNNQALQSSISLITSLISIGMNFCIGFFISPVIVRDLGVEANGFAQLANNFVSYAGLMTIAINAMAARFTTIAYHQGDIKKASHYYSSAMVGNLFAIGALIVPAILLIWKIDRVVTIQTTKIQDVQLLFALVFLNFFISTIYNVLNIATTVTNTLYISNIITMVGAMIRIGILLVLFNCFEVKVFFISLAAFVVTAVSCVEYYLVKKKLVPDLKFDIRYYSFKTIKELVASGVWGLVNKCGDLLMTGFDLLLTNILIGPIQMGVLSVAKMIPTNLISIAATISWNWNPKMMREYAEGKIDCMLQTLDTSAKISSIIIAIPTMVFCVFSREFYTLWMPTENASLLAALSILSLFSYFILAGSASVFNLFVITNHLKVNSISYVISAGISIIISYACVKYTDYGLFAIAGVSTTIICIRNLVFLLPYAAKCINLKWYTFYKYVFYNAACSLIVAAVAFVMKLLIPLDNWFFFIGACAIAGVLSIVILVFTMLEKQQRNAILKLIKR